MNESKGSRVLGAVLLVVIIAVVFIGLWAFMSMAFVQGGAPSGSVVFTFGAIFLGAVAIATVVWLIRLVGQRNAEHSGAAVPPRVDQEPPPAV
jgi:hypothetical protein